jgi:uncharacterized protein involved in type VI secretion and phage assembly
MSTTATIATSLPGVPLLLERFVGREFLSRSFCFRLNLLLAPGGNSFTFDQLLGQSVTITVTNSAASRTFNGIICKLSQGSCQTSVRM